MINQLTKHTSATGQVADSWDAAHPYGPYLWRIPPAPVGNSKGDTQVAIDAANSPPLVTTGDEAGSTIRSPVRFWSTLTAPMRRAR